jgi:hypothetical protein
MDLQRAVAALLLGVGLWLMALMGAGCTNGGPTGHRVTCTDYRTNGPVGGCE